MLTRLRRLFGKADGDHAGFYNHRLMWFPTLDALEAERAAWGARLAEPKFDELERYFGVTCPADLRWLYEAHDLRAGDGFIEAHGHSGTVQVCIWPADAKTLDECWSQLAPGYFPFAELMGSFYSIDFRAGGSTTCPVYFTQLGTEASRLEADSLRQFVVKTLVPGGNDSEHRVQPAADAAMSRRG